MYTEKRDYAYYTLYGGICITSLAVLFSIGIGTAEAVVLSNSTNAKHECGPAIWYCILACCIVHFIGACINMFHICKKSNKTNVIMIALSIVSIWVMICYYDTTNECIDVFSNKYSDLWKMIFIEVVLFYIACGVFGTIILVSICSALIKLCIG